MRVLRFIWLFVLLLWLTIPLNGDRDLVWEIWVQGCVYNSSGGLCHDYNYMGVDDDATNGWDQGIDQEEPPPGMGEYIRSYFYHADYAPNPTDLSTDYRATTFLEDGANTWRLYLTTNVTPTPTLTYEVQWQINTGFNLPDTYSATLTWGATDIDMLDITGDIGIYQFSSSSQSVWVDITIDQAPGYPYISTPLPDHECTSFDPVMINLDNHFDVDTAVGLNYSYQTEPNIFQNINGSTYSFYPLDDWTHDNPVPTVIAEITATTDDANQYQVTDSFEITIDDGIPYIADPIGSISFLSLGAIDIDLSNVFGVTGNGILYFSEEYNPAVSQSINGYTYSVQPAYPYTNFTNPQSLGISAASSNGYVIDSYTATLANGIPYVHQSGNPLSGGVTLTSPNPINYLLTTVFGVTGGLTPQYSYSYHPNLVQDIQGPAYSIGLNMSNLFTGTTQTQLTASSTMGTVNYIFDVTNEYNQGNQPPEQIQDFGTITITQNLDHTIPDLDDYFNDPDTPDLDYSCTTQAGSHLTVNVNPTTNALTIDPDQAWFGNETITITASDGDTDLDVDVPVVVNPSEPLTPTGLTVQNSNGTFTLSWNAVTTDINGFPLNSANIQYRIYYSSSGPVPTTYLTTVSNTTAMFYLPNQARRFWRVTATNGGL